MGIRYHVFSAEFLRQPVFLSDCRPLLNSLPVVAMVTVEGQSHVSIDGESNPPQ